jgi:hypothetical protein
MAEEMVSDMDGESPSIPIGYDYEAYTYDPDEIADTARTEASSAHDYKYENGRRYHAYREGAYPMPNDDLNTEHERIAHTMFGVLLDDRLYLPPIKEPKNVIDLGTGIGLCEFTLQYIPRPTDDREGFRWHHLHTAQPVCP